MYWFLPKIPISCLGKIFLSATLHSLELPQLAICNEDPQLEYRVKRE